MAYFNWLIIQQDTDSSFIKSIMWNDEYMFTENGEINAHNDQYWNNKNPYYVQEMRHKK